MVRWLLRDEISYYPFLLQSYVADELEVCSPADTEMAA